MAKKKQSATYAEHQATLLDAVRDLPSCLVVAGDEPWLRRDAIDSLLTALRKKHPDLEDTTVFGPANANDEPVSLSSLVNEFSAPSLFASNRLIIVRRATHLLFGKQTAEAESETEEVAPAAATTKKSKRPRRASPEEMLIAYVEKPAAGTWVIFELDSLNKQRRVGKALTAHTAVIPCPQLKGGSEVQRWMQAVAKEWGKELARDVPDLLTTAHGTRLSALYAELEKLAIYAGEEKNINREDVEMFLTGSVEFDVFKLTNAVEARDLNTALLYARRILVQGVRDQGGKKSDGSSSGHMALSILASTMQGILKARIASSGNVSSREAATALGTSPWRAEKLLTAAKNYPLGALQRILKTLAVEAHASHDTGADIALSLERAVVACCKK